MYGRCLALLDQSNHRFGTTGHQNGDIFLSQVGFLVFPEPLPAGAGSGGSVMPSIWDELASRGLTATVIFTTELTGLLQGCQLKDPVVLPIGNDHEGEVTLGLNAKPLGFLSLDLTPPGPDIAFRLKYENGGFRFWLRLSRLLGVKVPFGFLAKGVAALLKPARRETDGEREWLVPDPAVGDVRLEGTELSLLVEGTPGEVARQRLTTGGDGPEGIVELSLVPPTVLLGGSGFGLEVTGNVVLDDSAEEKPPGETKVDGKVVETAADTLSWRGLAIRSARFYLPDSVPFIAGHAVDAHIEVGIDPPGLDLSIRARVPPKEGQPGLDVLIECRDPQAAGLDSFQPTLVEVAMTLPVESWQEKLNGQPLTLVAGKPVVARLRFARGAADPQTRLTLGLEAQGPDGILTLRAPEGGVPARIAVGAMAFATALVAQERPGGGDASGVVLGSLLVAGLGLSAFLEDKGRVTLNGVELDSTGPGLPLGEELRLRLDYSVDVVVQPIKLGALSVQMSEAQPMRVRHRNVRLTFIPQANGLEKFKLDFSRAEMEIEDPGGWIVDSPGSIFDILGTRSGRGSMWFEVDLRFKLNLGPLRVSGATIRATFDEATNKIDASLRGLDVALAIPALVQAGGSLQLLKEPGGFAADLALQVVPLNLATRATVVYKPRPAENSYLLYLRLAADLPGPLPIANTGFGIFGLAGSFGLNAVPEPPTGNGDPIVQLLKWDSGNLETAFVFQDDARTFGAEAVIGTLPDFGFSFSTKAGLFVTVPEVAVRAVLYGKVLSPRLKVTDRPSESEAGLSFKGVGSVDPKAGVGIALLGQLKVPVLLDATVPLGAWFPAGDEPRADRSDWFIYLGADGYSAQGRAIGPVRAEILPGPLGQSGDTYVMLRGKGIADWPRGQPGALDYSDGFLLAFGFGLDIHIGPKPIAWLEIGARADLLISTSPLTLAGFGRLAGSLNLGPFSIGVDARLAFLVAEGTPASLAAHVCGRIDLFFTEIEGCVDIAINGKPPRKVPPPLPHPLDRVENGAVTGDLVHLIDHHYERIATLSRSRTTAPVVWPDSLLHLGFTVTPTAEPGCTGGQFPDVETQAPPAEPIGSEMLEYRWSLAGLSLSDVSDDEDGPGQPVIGPLSAAWQKGKDGPLGVRPQAGELVLLTYEPDIWTAALADGGAKLPPAPSEDPGTLCHYAELPRIGWAVGSRAVPEGGRMRMLPDPLSPDRIVSRFSALVTDRHSGLEVGALMPATAALLPRRLTYRPPEVSALDPPVAAERSFDGLLRPGTTEVAEAEPRDRLRMLLGQWAEIEPSEPIGDPCLWLVIDEEPPQLFAERFKVSDEHGRSWSPIDPASGGPSRVPLPGGQVALRFAPPPGPPLDVKRVTVEWGATAGRGILGLGGITQAARAAAAARSAAAAATAATLAEAAAKAPQPPDVTSDKAARCLLTPGRTYRLEVRMAWTGTIYEQDESGARKAIPSEAGTLPTAAGEETRSYFFRTAVLPDRVPLADRVYDPVPSYGTPERLDFVRRRRDLFEPEMLARHLLGYTPAQSEPWRFRDDPVQAHFDAAHVAALAETYGFTLKVDLRRVDVWHDPNDAGSPGRTLTLDSSWIPLAAPELLPLADAMRHTFAVEARCPLPKPGASLSAQPPLLEGRAWYEVYVLAQSLKPATVADGRLPGVTFRTSRWRSPTEMLSALGFEPGTMPDDPMGRPPGDLEAAALPTFERPVVEDDDAAFEDALIGLGLDGLPPPGEAGRASQLWLPPAGGAAEWGCIGLLVESPEPIHRTRRLELAASAPPHLVLARGGGTPFPVRRRDRSGTRLLLLADEPFAPRAFVVPGLLGGGLIGPARTVPAHVRMELADLTTGTSLSGRLALVPRPAFAED